MSTRTRTAGMAIAAGVAIAAMLATAGAAASPRLGRAPAASPRLAAGPAPVSPLSASFVSGSEGWLLAGEHCATYCKLVLRQTVDGGRHWRPVPAPPAPAAPAPGGRTPADAVSQIRFATVSDGWAFGPGLWVTHDAGRQWHRVNTHGWTVAGLAAGGGRVIAAFGRHVISGSTAFGAVQVFTAPVSGGAWRPIAGAHGSGLADLTVTVSGHTGYLSARWSTARAEGTELLAGPVAGSGRWRSIPLPCHTYWNFDITLAASPRGRLALGCASQGFPVFSEYKRVWESRDGGRTWQRLTSLPMTGYLGQISITSGGTVLVSGGHSNVYISWDGGKTWHTSPSLSRADLADGLAGTMVTSSRGFVLQDSYYARQVWFTRDDARTWTPVIIR